MGSREGTEEGKGLGSSVGTTEGTNVGASVGTSVGSGVGRSVGSGDMDGRGLGAGEGLRVATTKEMEFTSTTTPVAFVRALLNSGETSVSTIDAARASALLSPISARDPETVMATTHGRSHFSIL